MPTIKHLPVRELRLDPENYRTSEQNTERAEIHALITGKSDWFWGLLESLLNDGFHLNENVLVLEDTSEPQSKALIVHEGNRRIACLKIILGIVDPKEYGVPEYLQERIRQKDGPWLDSVRSVPCTLFTLAEKSFLRRLVGLIHGKDEKAGRLPWNAVARARQNRDEKGASEPGLELLEKYLRKGKNISPSQALSWGGYYPLSVLNEAIGKIAPRLGYSSSKDMVHAYPLKMKGYRTHLENILSEVGFGQIGFDELRGKSFGDSHGIPQPPEGSGQSPTANPTKPSAQPKRKGSSLTDPKSVRTTLKNFQPNGAGREKLWAVRDEAIRLKVDDTPIAFCFLLRSMFELSATVYCVEHNISVTYATKNGPKDRSLVDLLEDAYNELTKGLLATSKLSRSLHGAKTELKTPDRLLSVTSMNQLVHNPNFSIIPSDVCRLFHTVFPMLDHMNR